MDVLAAYREVGRYRGAAQLCGNTHKTVRRIVERHNAGGAAPPRRERGHNYDRVAELVADRVQRSQGRISAKRLLPAARTAGYEGSPRNSREKAEVPVVDGHGVNPDQGLARPGLRDRALDELGPLRGFEANRSRGRSRRRHPGRPQRPPVAGSM